MEIERIDFIFKILDIFKFFQFSIQKSLVNTCSMNNINIRHSVAFTTWQYKVSVTIYTQRWHTFSKRPEQKTCQAQPTVQSLPPLTSAAVPSEQSQTACQQVWQYPIKLYLQKSTNRYILTPENTCMYLALPFHISYVCRCDQPLTKFSEKTASVLTCTNLLLLSP